MTLSSHTAPDVRPLLERLCLVHRLLLFPVGQWPRPNTAAPSLQPHYRAFDATMGCSAPAPRFGTLALAVGAACGLSFHVIGVTKHRVSRSIRKPGRASRPLHAGCPSGRIKASPQLVPEGGATPRSDIAQSAFDTSAAVRLRSPRSTVPAEILSRRFRNAHHHGFCPQQLAVALDRLLITELEGPSFISRTVARRR